MLHAAADVRRSRHTLILTRRVPLHARRSGRECSAKGKGDRSRLHPRHRSPPKAAAIDATHRKSGCHCTLAALGESAVRRATARLEEPLRARHRSPPRAAAIDATPRDGGCHCTLAALGESAVRGARVCGCELSGCHCTLAALGESAVRGARANEHPCTLAIDLRPKRRRSMPPIAKVGATARSRLWARVQCGGQGRSFALARPPSISAQSGGDRCRPAAEIAWNPSGRPCVPYRTGARSGSAPPAGSVDIRWATL